MCKNDTKNPRVASSVRKAVLAVLRGHRFFCEPPVNLRAVDLDYKARPLYPCSEEFLNEMEKCATPVRKEFKSPDSTFTKLCRYFYIIIIRQVFVHNNDNDNFILLVSMYSV